MINFYPDITLYREKIKKRNFLLKIQTEVLYLFVKALFSPFDGKISMENYFGFCTPKNSQTYMNTDKHGLIIYYDRPG